MALPFVPTSYHSELYAQVGPLAYDDANQNYALFKYTGAIASLFDQIEGYARDQDDGTPGWGILLDINRCPAEALPWLGQFVGVDPASLSGLTTAQQRTKITNASGLDRGTIAAMVSDVQKLLTGTKTVYVKERDASVAATAGGAYGLTVATFASETPSTAAVLKALIAQKPAGIILSYSTVTGWTFIGVNSGYASFNAVKAAFVTMNGLRNNIPGT